MPESVAAASPVGVMPWTLAQSFQEKRTLALDQNRYPDGTVQSRVLVSSSRKGYSLSDRLTADQLADLIDFFETTCVHGTEAFYFYNVYETTPKYSYDETGVATVGRHLVRFDGPLQFSLGMGRNPAQLSLIEVS